jgi:hypothetical protein
MLLDAHHLRYKRDVQEIGRKRFMSRQAPNDQPGLYQQWQIQGQFTKSYTTPAIITLVLYCVLWLPGLIANIVYLVEARKTKQITGITPDGYGCLWALLITVCSVTAISAGLAVFLLFASAASPH